MMDRTNFSDCGSYNYSETEGEGGAVKHVQVSPLPNNSLLTVPMRKFCCGFLLPVFVSDFW